MVPMLFENFHSIELSNINTTNLEDTIDGLLAIVKMYLGLMIVCERLVPFRRFGLIN